MNQKDLYRAIGNISDRHIVNVRGRHSVTGTHSIRDSSYERTIVMDVVKQKKIRLRIFAVAAAVLVAAGVAAAALLGSKKDKKEYKEKKIDNYFRATETALPDNIDGIVNISAGKEYCYLAVHSSANDEEPFVFVYDIGEETVHNIDLGDISGTTAQMYIGNKNYYICMYNKKAETTLVAVDRSTLHVTDSIELGINIWPTGVQENEDDTITVSEYTLTDTKISEICERVFDADFNEVSGKIIADKDIISDRTIFKEYFSVAEGGYVIFLQNSDSSVDMCRYDAEGNEIYTQSDIMNNMPGRYECVFLSADNNPVIVSSEIISAGSHIFHFNEFDISSGELIKMYDGENDILKSCDGFLNILSDGIDYDEYDFRFVNNGHIYGYWLDSDEVTEIFNTEDCPDYRVQYLSNAELNDGVFLVNGSDKSKSESGYYICRADTEGSISSMYKIDDVNQFRRIRENTDGKMTFLYNNYFGDNMQFCIGTEEDNGKISTVRLKKCKYTENFIMDSTGNIAVSVSDGIDFYNSEGEPVNSISASGLYSPPEFFRAGEMYYTVYPHKDGTSEVRKIDFENHSVSDVLKRTDYIAQSIYDGTEEYDAVFKFSDGLYGYSINDNSVKEIINWLDSDIDGNDELVPAALNSNLIVSYQFGVSDSREFSVYRRVNNEELKKIQERPVLNVAVEKLNNGLIRAVNKYNSQNENIKVHIEDYSRYDSVDYGGAERFNADVITGNIPDIIISEPDFDLMRFSKSGFLEDISKYMKTDSEFDTNNYFTNIFDAYAVNGKQFGLPVTFQLNALIGKKSDELLSDTVLDNSKFFSIANKENLFSYELRENLKSLLITDRINEFCDIYAGKSKFESPDFINFLNIVKENSVTEEEFTAVYELNDFFEKVNGAVANDIAVFDVIGKFGLDDYVWTNARYHNHDIIWCGLPSENGGGYTVSSNMAAVFKSSEHKQEAWNFISYLLSDEVQKDIVSDNNLADYIYQFPVSKAALEQLVNRDIGYTLNTLDVDGGFVEIVNLNETEAEELIKMIDSVKRASLTDESIRKIIDEQTDIFFENGQTAEETAKNIQNKVSMYLKEIK